MTTGSSRLPAALGALVLLLVVTAVFWQVQAGAFVLWDDDINIVENDHLRSLSPASLGWMFTDFSYMRRYVPLTWLNWAVEHHLFGLTPRSAHTGNLVLHLANALLVFALILGVLRRTVAKAADSSSRAAITATLGALLWAVHPLRVEPVAWASGRIYCLATFFLLASTVLYLRASTRPDRTVFANASGWFSWLAYACSLLTYPIAAGFLVVLVVIDWRVTHRIGGAAGWRRWTPWLEKAAFAAPSAAILGVTVWARIHATGIWAAEQMVGLDAFGPGARVAQACFVVARYLWKTLAPTHLSPVYTHLVSFHPSDAPFVASIAACVVLSALAWWMRRRASWVAAVWLCYLALLAPMMGFTEHPHYANDRYSELAAIPLSVALAAALYVAATYRRLWLATAGAATAAVFALSLLSVRQVRAWHDTPTLFRHMLAELGNAPYRADILTRFSKHWTRNGDRAQAGEYLARAIEVNPKFPDAYAELGFLAEDEGDPARAISFLNTARRLDSRAVDVKDLARVHAKLGLMLEQQQRLMQAATEYTDALKLQPDNTAVALRLAKLHRTSGNDAAALELYENVLRADPRLETAHNALGVLFARQHRLPDAIEHFRAAIALKPDMIEAHFNLGLALADLGKADEARNEFQAVLRIQPTHKLARQQLEALSRSR